MVLMFIYIMICCFLTAETKETFQCDHGTLNDSCEVINKKYDNWNNYVILNGAGTLTLENSLLQINGVSQCYHGVEMDNCFLQLVIQKEIKLINSILKAPKVMINTSILIMDNRSSIITSGLGNPFSPYGKGSDGHGGGYGGDGGRAIKEKGSSGNGVGFGSAVSPHDCGGPSVGKRIINNGGGVVIINVTENIELNGSILSNGSDAIGSGVEIGGGAGGSIFIIAKNINGTGSISANGGRVLDSKGGSGGGGGGGRIYIRADSNNLNNADITAYGGTTKSTTYMNGGCGTYVDFYWGYNYIGLPGSTSGITRLTKDYMLKNIQITNCKLVLSAVLNASKWLRLSKSTLISESTKHPMEIVASNIDIHENPQEVIEAHSINIFAKESLTLESKIIFTNLLFINATKFVLSKDAQLKGQLTSNLTIISNDFTTSQNSEIVTNSISLSTTNANKLGKMQLRGKITLDYQPESPNCSNPVMTKNICQYPRAGLWFRSDLITLEKEAHIHGNINFICATNFTLDGVIDSKGCAGNKGTGKGGAGKTVGGGGGHGGDGGKGVNSKGETSVGGKHYDDEKTPSAVGSGGGTESNGGKGGGYISLTIKDTMLVGKDSSLDASGEDGHDDPIQAKAAGGGGSGGAIFITTRTLTALGGTFNVSGGNGGKPGGGGGGGGIIRLNWVEIKFNSHDAIIPNISIKGGQGGGGINHSNIRGYDGKLGKSNSNHICNVGEGGLFCKACARGKYKNVSGNELCQPCQFGRAQSSTNSTSCFSCKQGTYSKSGATNCTLCPGGRYSHGNTSSCQECHAGNYSHSGWSSCLKCRVNTNSKNASGDCPWCTPGKWSDSGQSSCQQCDGIYPKPFYSKWAKIQDQKKCPYTCDGGYVYPKCITPFDQFFSKLGGPYVFAAIIIVTVLLAITPFLLCWYKKQKAREAQKQADWEEVRFLANNKKRTAKRRRSSFEKEEFKSKRHHNISTYASLLKKETEEFPINVEDLLLKEKDLPNHLYRIYFYGCNSFLSPWRLPLIPSAPFDNLVYPKKYTEFALDTAKMTSWTSWESRTYYLLCIFYFPAAILFLNYRRKVHLYHFVKYHALSDHVFLRNYQARALSNSIKLGFSLCRTVLWLDVMCYQGEDCGKSILGKPNLPIVFVVSGTGNFFSPFHLDVTDCLIKSMSSYFGHNWFQFLHSLNTYLRTITLHQVIFPKYDSFSSCLKYIDMMNKGGGIGIGSKMPLSGIRVDLGLTKANYTPKKWRQEFLDSRLEISESNETITSNEEINDSDRDPTTICSIPRICLIITAITNNKKLQNNQNPESKALPYGAEPVEKILEDPALKSRDSTLYIRNGNERQHSAWSTTSKHSLWTRILNIFLFNVHRKKTYAITVFFFFFLLICHIGLVVVLGITFGEVDPPLFYLYLCIFPLLPPSLPIIALTALLSDKIIVMRLFAVLNLLCSVNDTTALIGGLFSFSKLGWALAICLPCGMLFIQILLGCVCLSLISHLEFKRDVALSYKDYLKNKMLGQSSIKEYDKQ